MAQAFQEYLLAENINKPVDFLEDAVLSRLEEMLLTRNIEGLITVLRAVFAGIPYHLHLSYEAYYHSVLIVNAKTRNISEWAVT